MPVRIVVGGNWGDEGKGRMVDYFAKDADCVRPLSRRPITPDNTVINDRGKFALRPRALGGSSIRASVQRGRPLAPS